MEMNNAHLRYMTWSGVGEAQIFLEGWENRLKKANLQNTHNAKLRHVVYGH